MSVNKILHVVDSYHPQLGYQEVFLAKTHSMLGYKVSVLTSNINFDFPYYNFTVKNLLGPQKLQSGIFYDGDVKIFRLRGIKLPKGGAWLIGFKNIIAEFDPDVVICHGVTSFNSLRIASIKKEFNFKLVYDIHMHYAIMTRSLASFYRLYKFFIKKVILKNADKVVAISHETKRFANEVYGIPLEHIDVIPLGADIKRFAPSLQKRKKIREKLGIKSNDVCLIYAGKVIPEKGVDWIIKAGLRLLKKHKNVQFLILGDGPPWYLNSLHAMVPKKLKQHFVFHKTVLNAELPDFYNACDVGVWPKEVTITTIEAMSCGLPVIVSSLPVAIERIRYNNGFSVSSIDELYKAMLFFVENPDKRVEMGKNSRMACETELNWESIAKRFLEL